MSEQRHDLSAPAPQLVNGVFAGGGAKAIAYAGALQALEDRGLWFGSVAGASAGAIAATLVASGMNAAECAEAVPAGLATLQTSKPRRLFKAAIGHAHSLYEGAALRAWLDDLLRQRVGGGGGPVTFAELFDATGIGLYVTAMDLVHGLPVVFSRYSTPDVEVAGAVLASSAIPGAFPAGRAVFDSPDGGAVVHQLIDGGAWANYPSFIFDDSSFRAWVRGDAEDNGRWPDDDAWADESERQTLGLVLGEADTLDQRQAIGIVPAQGSGVNRRFDRGPSYTSSSRIPYLFGATFSSDWARLLLAIAIAVWALLSIIVLPVAIRWFAAWLDDWVPDVLTPIVLVALTALTTLSIVTAIAALLGLVVIGRLIADTLLPALRATVGVPLDVPPWLGMGADSLVVYVPRGTLSTTEFSVDPETRAAAIGVAHASVLEQLDRFDDRLRALTAGRSPGRDAYRPGSRAADDSADARTTWPTSALVTVAATVVVASAVAWAAVWAASTGGIWIVAAAVVAAVVLGAGTAWKVAGHGADAAAGRSLAGVGDVPRRSGTATALIVGGAALVVAGLVTSALTATGWGDDVFRGDVVSAIEVVQSPDEVDDPITTNRYVVDLESGDEVTFENERHLRIGETVFVSDVDDASGPSLAGRADDWTFALAVALVTLGVIVTTAGLKRRSWEHHLRRLHALAEGWRAAAPPPN